MRVTLASLLAESMKDVSLFQSENIDSQKYLEWVDKYQVNGLILPYSLQSHIFTNLNLLNDAIMTAIIITQLL